MTVEGNTRDRFEVLLTDLGEHPERSDEIVAEIERTFCQNRAVVVMDMCGFSRTTAEYGIITFLMMIHQMRRVASPVVEEYGGTVVRAEADNVWCLFDDVAKALEAVRDIAGRLESANIALPREREMLVSTGIGFGSVINIEDHDFYGDEVNRAGKLGEDLAEPREILLTEAARAQLTDDDGPFEERKVTVSGLDLTYYAARP
jgi:class 3 adenylate cyclase